MREIYKQEKKARRRYKVVKPFRFFVFVLICITSVVLAGYAIFGPTHADAESLTRYTEVKVQENDTLWDLVETYNPNADIDVRNALYEVYRVNNIDAADIKAGDTILIPVY